MKQFSKIALLTFAALALTVVVRAEDPKPAAKAAASGQKPAAETAPAKIKWLTYDEGLAKAKREDKSIIIDFTATWCGWCKRMDAETFSDPEVIQYMSEKIVPVKVWGDDTTKAGMVTHLGQRMTQRALTQEYAVRGFPCFWFLDSSAGKLGPVPGYKSKEKFMPYVKFVAEKHYKTTSLEDYLAGKTGPSPSIKIGMSTDEVKAILGPPKDINRTVTEGTVHEQWVYESKVKYAYFDNGKLTSWQD